MKLLLSLTLEGKPPSKNRTHGYARGHVYVLSETRSWMDAVTILARTQRKAVMEKSPVTVKVLLLSKSPHSFDADGALPVLFDSIFGGLSESGKVDDQWVDAIYVQKKKAKVDRTVVTVWQGVE